jgi:hypothetical protein
VPAVLLWLLFLGIGVVLFALNLRGGSSCEQRIRQWASDNGFTLQSIARTSFGPTPWGWLGGRGTRFYQVRVVDSSGATREAWVRIRAWPVGSDNFDLKWDQ